MNNVYDYFKDNLDMVEDALKSIEKEKLDALINDALSVLKNNKKIIVAGLGKNIPVCEKFAGTMNSLGLSTAVLNTNSALHGELGTVHKGDLVIILSKSADTEETVIFSEILKQRGNSVCWLITFNDCGKANDIVDNTLCISLRHEGDLWDVMPNNSTTVTLILLQTVAMSVAEKAGLSLEEDFKPNHPGGIIGAKLNDVR